MRPLTETEAARVIETASSRPAAHRLVLRLLLEYRLTTHEICRLTLDRVAAATLSVEDKRGELRDVELQGLAARDLEEVLRGHPGGRLLIGPAGAFRPDALRRLLRSASLAAGVDEEISIHRSTRVVDIRA